MAGGDNGIAAIFVLEDGFAIHKDLDIAIVAQSEAEFQSVVVLIGSSEKSHALLVDVLETIWEAVERRLVGGWGILEFLGRVVVEAVEPG